MLLIGCPTGQKNRTPSQPSIIIASDGHDTLTPPPPLSSPFRPPYTRAASFPTSHTHSSLQPLVMRRRRCGHRGRFDRWRRRRTPIGSQATARKVRPSRECDHIAPLCTAVTLVARRSLWTRSGHRGRAVQGRRRMAMLGRTATSSHARPAVMQTARILR
jgi:hypothetical protein